jgi:predicted ABC-type ATPase
VTQGGHNVPANVVRRRFDLGLNNFQTIYRYEVDFWHLYHNSGDILKLVDEGKNV